MYAEKYTTFASINAPDTIRTCKAEQPAIKMLSSGAARKSANPCALAVLHQRPRITHHRIL